MTLGRLGRAVAFGVACTFLVGILPARGSGSHRATWRRPSFRSALVIDADSGTVLYEKDAHAERTPASLVKMMLELLVLEALEAGEIDLTDPVTIPREVHGVRGTRIRFRRNEVVSVRDLLYATVLPSANDAATALAIHLAGSTEACVARMNRRARMLGMTATRYVNVHGLDYGDQEKNVTTAWDQALLARALVKKPTALALSSTQSTTIRNGQTIRSTNRLLTRFPGVDGLKTGFTRRAGFCLVATAKRQDLRIISVVMGSTSSWRRFNESKNLLYEAFLDWQRVRVVSRGEDLGERLAVREGEERSVRLIAGSDLDILVPARRRNEIEVSVAVPASTRAPVAEGWTLGRVQVLIGDSLAAECPAVAARSVARIQRPLESPTGTAQ